MSNASAVMVSLALLSASAVSWFARPPAPTPTVFAGRGWRCEIDRDINPDLVSVRLEVRDGEQGQH